MTVLKAQTKSTESLNHTLIHNTLRHRGTLQPSRDRPKNERKPYSRNTLQDSHTERSLNSHGIIGWKDVTFSSPWNGIQYTYGREAWEDTANMGWGG
ncbi:hypothetical protein N7447_002965 [Penicillium robsamsonii]|uniref:uncharacterized protein n=1 Tax=Penicillium robsamsonii TaxID=1792511 RepID=UPI0025470212|nr:uncharacterized protein N7447_002965 [Penicillium robsamsonii]KAJ5836939.1 hypothetical protein N7447_002965 [Penicillium robsamsonii]